MQGPGVRACVTTWCVHAWESSMPACVVRPGACMHAGIRRVRTHMGVWHRCGDPACTGRGSVLCMHVHGDPVRVRMGILCVCVGTRCVHAWGSCMCAFVRGDLVHACMGVLRACVGTWCVHAWESCVHAFVRGDPVRACMVILHACVGTQCMHTWGSCVRGPGPCMHRIQHAQWGLDACVRGSGMGVRIQRAWAEDQYHI